MKQISFSRRDFLKSTAAVSAAAVLSQAGAVYAAGPEKIRLALVGCGGRGNGALSDCINAAKYLNIPVEIVALADHFKDRALKTAEQHGLSPDICFDGPAGYKKVMESIADVVLLVTPPAFRPTQFEAAINAGKHVFMEKPVAVDAPGARKIMEVGEIAKQKKLCVVAGTQRRYAANYRKTKFAIEQGALGPILGGAVYWCGGKLWHQERRDGESDADYMVRNWVSFTEMSGDHIVEQHIHNIDIANWFIGRTPKLAIGFGGRARRKTGNQFDFFNVDFDYDEGCRIHSMCRQVNGCYNQVSELFTGSNGTTYGSGPVKLIKAVDIKYPDYEQANGSEMVQEHVELLRGIIDGKPINAAKDVAESTLTAIMGRISAYTGQLVRWRDLTDASSNSPWYSLKLTPGSEEFENGTVKAPADDVIAIPGQA
jgi:predicted dehydrogenase